MAGIFSRRNVLVGGVATLGIAGFAAYQVNPDFADWIDGTFDREEHQVGVVELGSGGPKWTVLRFAPRQLMGGMGADRYDGVQRASRYDRHVVASGDIEVEVRNPDAIPDVVAATMSAAELLENNGVQPGRSVIVGSSSIARLPAEHLDNLRKAFQNANVQFEMVNAAQEAEYAFRWLVARADRENSTFIDIGSGNIKGGHINPETNEFAPFEIAEGISSLMGAAQALPNTTTIQDRMTAVVAERITPRLEVLKRDGLANDRMYLSGGAVWAMRCVTHPDIPQNEAWVRLTAADVDRYYDIVTADPSLNSLTENLPANSSLRRRIAAIHEAIPQPNRILASAHILKAMSEQLDFDSTPHVFFADEGQFAWSTMYLLARLGLEPRL